MTKTIKLSLAAAMVAGIATTASASNLQDAIQNVDVSGYVDYRLENKHTENDTSNGNWNEYAVNVTLTSKVNDMVKATVSAGFDEAITGNTNKSTSGMTTTGDTDPSISVSNAYFTFDLGSVTLMAGKQGIPSAFVDTKDTARTGTGLVALAKVNDALTVAAAHFVNTSLDVTSVNAENEAKTTELVAMGKAGMVSYQLNYNTTDVQIVEADRLYAKLSANVEGIKITAEHAQASQDGVAGNTTKYDDSSVSNISVAGKAGSVALSGTYFTADKSGNNASTDVAIDGDNDAAAHVKVWQLSTAAISNKGNGFALSAGMPVANNVSAKLVYAAATNDGIAGAADTDLTETLAMVTYKMSKNFKIHARYSVLNSDNGTTDTDTDYSRVQVRYSF